MSRMRVLVTGARAPAALQFLRLLARAGAEVLTADSLNATCASRSGLTSGHRYLPAPAASFGAFADAARQCIRDSRIDVVLCTCEEIFYWAAAAERDPQSFAPFRRANPSFEQLAALHDKGAFPTLAASVAAQCNVGVPLSLRRPPLHPSHARWVVKPAFSRFAVRTRLRLSPDEAAAQLSAGGWVAQPMLEGRESCSWGYYAKGREVLYAAYEPIWRAGRGSGIGLRAVPGERQRAFGMAFASRLGITGQLAFDWITPDSGVPHVIECNPRATSGVHFLDSVSVMAGHALLGALHGQNVRPVVGVQEDIVLPWAMWMFHGLRLLRPAAGRSARTFLRHARDAEAARDDPAPQTVRVRARALSEIALISIRTRCSLIEASTQDIEWNGAPIGDTRPPWVDDISA